MILAHDGQPPKPHDLWTAWNLDPLLLTAIVFTGALYWYGFTRGRRRPAVEWRAKLFALALVVLGIAFLSPVDSVSSALASAHMVQHLLLMLVAAPLLALSAPWPTLLRGTPAAVRRTIARWRGRIRLTRRKTAVFRHPVTAWLSYVGTLWFWHGAVPYGAALEYEPVHVLEHACFLAAGVLFWSVIVDSGLPGRTSPGVGLGLLFVVTMPTVFLSALLTFARTPWYDGYAHTTQAWGLTPLADQQLAGVIMWIPAGFVHLGSALALLVIWIRRSEQRDDTQSLPRPVPNPAGPLLK